MSIKEIIISHKKKVCPICGIRMDYDGNFKDGGGNKIAVFSCSNCDSFLHTPYKIFVR